MSFLPPDPVKVFRPRQKAADKSVAQKLFTFRYTTQISKVHLISEKEIAQFGTVSTGDKAVDKAMANEIVNARLTAPQMAEFLDEDITFALVNTKDSVEIFRHLMELLNDWANRATEELQSVTVPLEELAKLEKLAAHMYQSAKFWIAKGEYGNDLMHRLSMFGSRRRRHLSNLGEPKRAVIRESAGIKIVEGIQKSLAEREEY